MNKFAFVNNAEKTAVLACIKKFTPDEFYKAFSRFAQGFETGLQTLPGQQTGVVQERLQQLREMMQDFLYEVGLGQNRTVMTWIENVIGGLAPALQQSLKGQKSLQDQLSNVGRDPNMDLKNMAREKGNTPPPFSGQDSIVQEDDIGDVYPARGSTVSPRPATVPKDMKIKPGKQPSLMRQNPGANASTDAQYDNLIKAMLEIADLADEAGMIEEADKIAAVLPLVRTVKIAQYEGFHNYWIANGRAFEMAYKQKRMKGKSKPEDFRSAQEVWFEILDEYQKSLMTNQADFISKYAQKDYSIHDRATQEILLSRITPRIQAGSAPGVAFYEALEELKAGKHAEIVSERLNSTFKSISEAANLFGEEKIAELADSIIKQAGWFDDMSRGLIQKFKPDYNNPTTTYFNIINSNKDVIPKLNNLKQTVEAEAAAGKAVGLDRFSEIMQPVEGALIEYFNRMRLTKMPEARSATMPKSEMIRGGAGDVIDPAKLGQYVNLLSHFMKYISEDLTKRIDKTIYKAQSGGLQTAAEGYIGDYSDNNPAQTQQQQQAQPSQQQTQQTATPTPTEAFSILSNISKDPSKVDQSYESFDKLIKLYQWWRSQPFADHEIKVNKKGKEPGT